ncbi:MAG: hypothetical protein JO214_09500 [Frankiaceae bacterium]|nr:hypothetical protein [Frankiaceae bacterium]
MGFRNGLMMMVAGAFLTFAWTASTSVFDPRAFGVALLLAAAFSLAPDIALRIPRRHFAEAFDRTGTVLPARHQH